MIGEIKKTLSAIPFVDQSLKALRRSAKIVRYRSFAAGESKDLPISSLTGWWLI